MRLETTAINNKEGGKRLASKNLVASKQPKFFSNLLMHMNKSETSDSNIISKLFTNQNGKFRNL